MHRLILVTLVLAFFTACSSSGDSGPSDAGHDAASGDAGHDGGATDGGGTDSGDVDAGNTDAGDVSHGGNVFGVISATYTDKGGVGGSPALSTTGQHNIRQKHQEVEFVVNQSGTAVTTARSSARLGLSPRSSRTGPIGD